MRWNSKIAYAVGLITTDGSLSKDGRHIVLTSSEIAQLNTFKHCLEKNNKVTINPGGIFSKNTSYKVQLGDIKMYRWLVKVGLMPNKTFHLGSLKIPSKFFRDFLRGHLDGDGSIIYYKDRYNTKLNPKYVYDRLFVYFISSSLKHLKWIRSEIKNLISLSGSLNRKVDNRTDFIRHPMYTLKFSTKEAKRLLNWIYYRPDIPKLERKYNIARPFLSL